MYIRRAFGQSSEDRVSGLVTKANMAGFIVGLISGLITGAALFGISWSALLVALLFTIVGVALSIRTGGLNVLQRLWLRFNYGVRRILRATLVPPSRQPVPTMQDLTIVIDGEVVARPYRPKQ